MNNKEKLNKPFKVSWIIAVTSLVSFVLGIVCFTWDSNQTGHYFGLILVILSLVGLLASFFVNKFWKQDE